MCGFGIDALIEFAISLVVIIAVIALINWAFPQAVALVTGSRYWGAIQIVFIAVLVIFVLLLIGRLAQCSGLLPRFGGFGDAFRFASLRSL